MSSRDDSQDISMSWLEAANTVLYRHARTSKSSIYSVQVHRNDEDIPDDDTNEMRRVGDWLCVLVRFSRKKRLISPRVGFDLHIYPLTGPLPGNTRLVLD